MNPRISITVDAKNRASAVLTGLVTVGSKVDIEIAGLPSSIPDWREIDPYTGRSLRFRVVDCLGNDLVRYPLVKKGDESDGDTWTVSDEGVYSNSEGCEVDFDTHKLRHAFNQVPFNEAVEFGVILDSTVDSAQYAVGKMKIRQWCAASCDTPTVLPDWREILHGLKTDLESVYQSRTAAEAAASQSAASASGAAQSAVAADTSESHAAEYAAAANEAKEEAVDAMLKYPYIDEFGHWRVWSVTAGEWVDHGAASGSQTTIGWSDVTGKPTAFPPSVHAASHKTGGTDALTPADIGAVAAVPGKGLSSNDYTTAEKNKLAGIEAGAEVNPTPVAPSTEAAQGAFADAKKVAEFVNSSINAMAAFYITKNAAGDAFATKAELNAAITSGTFYNGGSLRTPTRNDYLYVLADESATRIIPGVNPTTRYSYDGAQWAFQIIVNNTALTSAQAAAINSGIYAALVTWLAAFKGNDSSTTLAALQTALAGKLDDSTAEWVEGEVYDWMTFVRKDGVVYVAKVDETSTAWVPGQWAEVPNLTALFAAVSPMIVDGYLPSKVNGEIAISLSASGLTVYLPLTVLGAGILVHDSESGGNDVVVEGGWTQAVWRLRKTLQLDFAEWDEYTTYPAGSVVRKRSSAVYMANEETTGDDPASSSKWTKLDTPAKFFGVANTALTARVNALIAAAGAAYLPDATPVYSASATYAVGNFVRHEGAIYCCKTAITVAESWTPAHWTALPKVADFFSESNTLLTARVNSLINTAIGDVNAVLAAALDGSEVA